MDIKITDGSGFTWYSSNGVVSFSSSHTALPADLPNFAPDAVVSSGTVRPYAGSNRSVDSWPALLRMRDIKSIPAVMFPYWSLPPICIGVSHAPPQSYSKGGL